MPTRSWPLASNLPILGFAFFLVSLVFQVFFSHRSYIVISNFRSISPFSHDALASSVMQVFFSWLSPSAWNSHSRWFTLVFVGRRLCPSTLEIQRCRPAWKCLVLGLGINNWWAAWRIWWVLPKVSNDRVQKFWWDFAARGYGFAEAVAKVDR